MALSKRDFEEIAQVLNESKVLGLFTDENAHKIFTRELGLKLQGHNRLFNMEIFEKASGVIPIESE